jgi:hypothetical protein
VIYPRAFFDLQLLFANKASGLATLPLSDALLKYTNLYIRFGLGRDFDPAHPIWREYLAGLHETRDRCLWTYDFYLTRSQPVVTPSFVATFGCFSYARLDAERIQLHFHNAERDGRSPLSIDRLPQRLTDLGALFRHLNNSQQHSLRVAGRSWLYNLEAYCRLFPRSYSATARVVRGRFQHLSLWGQFLDRQGSIKSCITSRFLERLEGQESLANLDQCFPFQVLAVEAPVHEFYTFYGV